MAALATACRDSVEIGGVAMDFEDHVAGDIAGGAIRVRCSVVKGLLEGVFGGLSDCGLGRKEFTEGG